MRTKRILIFLPLLLALVLLQSAFWVPSYGSQSALQSGRSKIFVEAKIGDAKLLNPILTSDAAGQEILERRIFDRLVEQDEQLNIIPWLAKSWEFSEDAYVAVRPERVLPDGTQVSAGSLLAAIERAFREGGLRDLSASLRALALAPAGVREQVETVVDASKAKAPPVEVKLRVQLPERVKISLGRVEGQLFERLEAVLGKGYFEGMDVSGRFEVEPASARAGIAPRFAELLPVGEHNPVVTFHLRNDARFHDGHPLTARDVQFTYQALVDPKVVSPRAASFETVARVEIVDDWTVRVVYKRLYSNALIDWIMGILPEHLLNQAALEREMNARKISKEARATFSIRTSDFNRRPIGSGPFRFVEWRAEQYVLQERNPDYWGEKPQYERLYTRIIPDKLAQELELRTGALDIYEAEPHQGDRLRADSRYQVVNRGEGFYTYIAYNQRRPLFQDPRVRQALGMAVNVDELIRYVLSGQGKRATGPFFSNTPFADPNTKPLPYDPKQALELLKQVGYVKNKDGWLEKDGKPFEFTLITNAGNPQRKAILTIAQENWKRLGIRCNTQAFEWTVFLDQFVHVRKFDAIVLGWVGGDINPDKSQLWHSSQVANYKLNFPGYANPKADALLERIRVEYDRTRQIELTRELHRLIAADQPYTFLYEPLRPYAIDRRIAILEPGPSGAPPRYRKITPAPSGELLYFFKRWVTRSGDAVLAAE
jgi:ABC-type transport system substrate-binding protein